MKRRTFLALAAGVAGAQRAGAAQAQGRARPMRLGYLSGGTFDELQLGYFRRGLERLGWVERRDFVLDARFANFDYGRFPTLTDELLRGGIDLLVVAGPAARMITAVQRRVPVVFAFSGDPVAAGFVESFARPGGNATGFSFLALDLAGKRLDILREIQPAARRVALLVNPTHPGVQDERRVTQAAATRLGLEVVTFEMRDSAEVEAALSGIVPAGCDSLSCLPDAVTLASREAIAGHARRARLPSVFGWKAFCEAGGLVSYGPSLADGFMRLAYFVERIANGAAPGSIPVELPTVIERAVNLRTAAEIGLTLPPSFVVTADDVIE